ncbi:MAG: hypothetical protein HUU06_12715 [Planctomycetaceae bacterium]|nr:hypothetical protein [Planctomycetota bacterium]NUN53631.1 hypothetical protein [Planctomycetaceae bacterium]
MDRPEGESPSFREDAGEPPPATSRWARGDYRPETVENPPPKFVTVGFRVPPDRMLEALLGGLVGGGVQVRMVDRDERLVMAVDEMPGGKHAAVTASVEEAAGGCRVRLVYDRPPGTRMDPRSDGLRLDAVLRKTEEELPRIMEE